MRIFDVLSKHFSSNLLSHIVRNLLYPSSVSMPWKKERKSPLPKRYGLSYLFVQVLGRLSDSLIPYHPSLSTANRSPLLDCGDQRLWNSASDMPINIRLPLLLHKTRFLIYPLSLFFTYTPNKGFLSEILNVMQKCMPADGMFTVQHDEITYFPCLTPKLS